MLLDITMESPVRDLKMLRLLEIRGSFSAREQWLQQCSLYKGTT